MITFQCGQCGKTFVVKDELSGRKARCTNCRASFVIPAGGTGQPSPFGRPGGDQGQDRISVSFGESRSGRAPESSQTRQSTTRSSPAKKPMRLRRLESDAKHMRQRFHSFPLIHIVDMHGDPPEKYQIEYRVRGVARGYDGQTMYRDQHLVEIELTREYPRQSPKCKILTPIFHPNFDPATICVGDHWTAAERLADLVIRIGEMIAYQAYNIKSPLDGEAAMWADLNQAVFPVDSRSLSPPEC
jgi:ubiquitin-protein ligase